MKVKLIISQKIYRKRSVHLQTSIKIVQYNKEVTDPKQIANSLNKHFSTVGKRMASKFKTCVNSKDALDYITSDVKDNLVISI